MFTTKVEFAIDGYTPNVQVNKPYDVPDWGVRLFGIAPFFGGVLILLYSVATLPLTISEGIFYGLIGFGTAFGSVGSGGDILAVGNPQAFKEFAAKTESEVPGFWEAIELIKR